VGANGRQDRQEGDIARPPMVFSGARAVSPPQPPRVERPPTSEGVTDQNTTLFECDKRGLTPFGAPSSDACDCADLAGVDGFLEPPVVEVVLVGVEGGEARDGLVEARALAEVGGDGEAVT
jgi:hypothetical protein